jgi:nucleotide-binding universal stress UspA family protein
MAEPFLQLVVVPTDYTALSLEALDVAVKLAHQCAAQVCLLHVVEVDHWDVPGADFAPGPRDVRDAIHHYRQKLEAHAMLEMKNVLSHRHLSNVTPVVSFGRPAAGILEYTRSVRADLICMGTHGHRPLPHLLMGSTTEGVMRGSTIPVLVVRETDKT